MTRHWLSVRQAAEELGYTEDTIRQYCAEKVFPGAGKANPDSSRSHWRIPEQDVESFGTTRATSRATSLDHKRRKELLRARRAA